MSTLAEHPTVRRLAERNERKEGAAGRLDAAWLRDLCLEAGADDVGFVSIDRPELDDQRAEILSVLPRCRTLISFVCRMNRENLRSPARSVANLEFHHTGDEVNDVARRIVAEMERRGVRALNPAMGFPMEMSRFPGKTWVVSHKPVAVAAGLGRMGIHRNVIHPRFGNFILLGTVLIDAEVSAENQPIDYNPCLNCLLCVAACPVGAIHPDGHFDGLACYMHNYREFMGGFTDWVTQIADSRDGRDYRRKVSDAESASMWQSLSFGANYKAAYCMAVCPAGEDVIQPFLENRKQFLDDVVRPLQRKEETIYVLRNSDAEAHAAQRFPHKKIKRVTTRVRASSIQDLLRRLRIGFQRGQSAGLDATYHFVFTGSEAAEATVIIRDQRIEIKPGLVGQANLRVEADGRVWLEFIAGERSLIWSLIRRKIRLHGSPKWLRAFGRCFAS